jgi:hypothetical protein
LTAKDLIMNPIDWFYAKGDKHAGPVNSAELKRLATIGELKPDDLVWREGMADWTVARNVRGLFEEEAKAAGHVAAGAATGQGAGAPPQIIAPVAMPAANAAPTATAMPAAFAATTPQVQKAQAAPKHLFDMVLDFVRAQYSPAFVESTTKRFVTIGRFGYLAAMGLTILVAVLLTLKEDPFAGAYLTEGAISLLALAVLQYVGGRFCEAGERLNRSTRENVSTAAFLDCVALLTMVSGATALIVSLFFGMHGLYWAVFAGVAAFVIAQFFGFTAIHPSLANVQIVSESRPSEDALGLIGFFAKALVRIAPVVFGVGAVFGCALLIYACVEVFTSSGPVGAWLNSIIATASLRWTGVFPLAAYLAYLLIYLLLDVLRAILVLPGKIEKSQNPDAK